MYDQLDDTLRSITMQLRAAIQAMHARSPPSCRRVLLGTLGWQAADLFDWHVRQFRPAPASLASLTSQQCGWRRACSRAMPRAIFDIYNEALSNRRAPIRAGGAMPRSRDHHNRQSQAGQFSVVANTV
jgi:hypothetical protein